MPQFPGGSGSSPAARGASTPPPMPSKSAAVEVGSLWPAMLPTPKMNSLLSDANRSTHTPQDVSRGPSNRGGSSTERVDHVIGLAFDRLWRDAPSVAVDEAAADSDPQLACTVDGYISHYFHRVAELSRESVYQTHQRRILSRMRDDVICGDRTGSMRELDERIQNVELDDKSIRAEIETLMKIVEQDGGRGASTVLAMEACCCASAPAVKPGELSQPATSGRVVPDCKPCVVQ